MMAINLECFVGTAETSQDHQNLKSCQGKLVTKTTARYLNSFVPATLLYNIDYIIFSIQFPKTFQSALISIVSPDNYLSLLYNIPV
jgi:hypothetical protein